MAQDVHCIIGASGQLGTEMALSLKAAGERVVLMDIKPPTYSGILDLPFERIDVCDAAGLADRIAHHHVNHIHHLAAALSARGEQDPQWAWNLNMKGLLNVLEIAAGALQPMRIFWPSSIAVFGPESGPIAGQEEHRWPATVYGISKNVGEQWCAWYRRNRGVDVRSVRYPGLIGTLAPPGGGTTDYAVEVFDHLDNAEPYSCFLEASERLPMMHMDDAVDAALSIMSAPQEAMRCEEAYNIQAMSFSPEELFVEIRRHVPDFRWTYAPDFRQGIAAGWPDGLDDRMAREDWGWSPTVDLPQLVDTMVRARRFKEPALGAV